MIDDAKYTFARVRYLQHLHPKCPKCGGELHPKIANYIVLMCHDCNWTVNWDGLCNRCGECCKMVDRTITPHVQTGEYCPHLLLEMSGKYRCVNYLNHLGTPLPDGGNCSPIEDCTFRAPDCPYNGYCDQLQEGLLNG